MKDKRSKTLSRREALRVIGAAGAASACPGNGACIRVTADDVTLSLNNKTLACRPRQPAADMNETTFGVQAGPFRR